MTSDSTPEFDFVKDEPAADQPPAARDTGGRYAAIETTPYMPAGMSKKDRWQHGHRTANKGLALMAISGTAWLMVTNLPMLFAWAPPSFYAAWCFSLVGQFSVIGVFAGLTMVVIGYARLILSKQIMIEHHLGAKIEAIADDDAERPS